MQLALEIVHLDVNSLGSKPIQTELLNARCIGPRDRILAVKTVHMK
jgi:hypothetical protein